MPFATKHFNLNQTVWVRVLTGSLAALCYGKFRGKGRYVSAWVKWANKAAPEIKEMEIDREFWTRIHGYPPEEQGQPLQEIEPSLETETEGI